MSDILELTIEELASIANALKGVPGTIGVVVRVAGIALQSVDDILKTLDARDIEEVRKERELYQSAGQAAYEASQKAHG